MATPTPSGKAKTQPSTLDIPKAIPELQRLVDECNTFKHGWALPDKHGYLALPDEDEALRIFGILQPQALQNINWPRHGFLVVSLTEAKAEGVDIPGEITKGKVVMPKGLKPEQISAKFKEITMNETYREKLPALTDWDGKELVRLVKGHPKVNFPDRVGVYLGVVQVGVHLTVYNKVKDESGTEQLSIYVQTRSPLASSYPGMLDQTAAGGLKYGETERAGICRETREEFSDEIVGLVADSNQTTHDGTVVFSTVRPKVGKKLAGTLEISTKVCFSLEAKQPDQLPRPQGRDSQVKGFSWMTAEEVVEALKNNKFKPNSALVMIKFLIDQEFLKRNVSGVMKLEESLQSKVPLAVPESF